MKALLIGCGGIGAMYDLETEGIHTHAKALKALAIDFDVYDTDTELAKKIAAVYSVKYLDRFKEDDLTNYTSVHICAPNEFHFFYLDACLKKNVPKIICEKPITLKMAELLELEEKYRVSSSQVFVNYIRRFLPDFIFLKELITPHLNHIQPYIYSILFRILYY